MNDAANHMCDTIKLLYADGFISHEVQDVMRKHVHVVTK